VESYKKKKENTTYFTPQNQLYAGQNKKLTHFRTTILLLMHKARETHLITQFKAKMPTLRALCAKSRMEREICSFCRSLLIKYLVNQLLISQSFYSLLFCPTQSSKLCAGTKIKTPFFVYTDISRGQADFVQALSFSAYLL
jgi:hypothetical protein